MSSIDLESVLSEEEQAIRERVHKFAEEVMRPAGIALDALADPQEVIAEDSILWDVYKKHDELGLEAIADPASGFTPIQQARLRSIIGEEMGWGDSGLSISFGVDTFPQTLALMSGKPELIERFGRPGKRGCWAITEPDHGGDLIRFATDPQVSHLGKPNCIAKKDGDSFVISGQKAAWVSNGTIAENAALFCAVDMGQGIVGVGGFVVPLDDPAVSRGKPLDKIGQRALNQGEIFFDGLRVPAMNLVVPPEASPCSATWASARPTRAWAPPSWGWPRRLSTWRWTTPRSGSRAACHLRASEREGPPLRDVPQGGGRAKPEPARGRVQRGQPAEAAVRDRVEGHLHHTAFEVASAAIQIFGGNGLSREYPVEKLMRDARASMIEDGCNEVLGLAAAAAMSSRARVHGCHFARSSAARDSKDVHRTQGHSK